MLKEFTAGGTVSVSAAGKPFDLMPPDSAATGADAAPPDGGTSPDPSMSE